MAILIVNIKSDCLRFVQFICFCKWLLQVSINIANEVPHYFISKCWMVTYINECPVVAPGPTVAIILSICNCKKAGKLGRAGTNVLAPILASWSSRPLSVRFWRLYRTWLLSSLTHDQTHRTDVHANGRSSLVKSTILSVQEQYTHVKYTCT